MAYEPLTEDQYNKAIASGLSHEQIIQFEQQRKQSENSGSSTDKPTMDSMPQAILNNLVTAAKGTGEAVLKGANEATFGAIGGITKAMTGKDLPEESMDESTKQMASGAAIVSPFPLGMVAEGLTKTISPVIKPLLKYENSLQQAKKAKTGLDTLRGTLGQGVQLAIKDVENVETAANLSKIPEKIASNIKKSVYDIQFHGINNDVPINTIGNLNKVKEATYDLLTSGDFVQASNAEKAQIRQFAGQISKEMRLAARKVGKPIDSALDSYSNFMKKYELINPKLVDRYGNAMGNKLKSTFKIFAEPATKQAWKDVSKISPEIKSVMGSMQRRELLKNILKVAGAAEIGKKTITGNF